MSAESAKARMVRVGERDSLISPLLECSQSGEFLCLQLPDGTRLWVHPEESLVGLVTLLGDPGFAAAMEATADDFVAGKGLTLAAGETPLGVLKDAVRSDEFGSLIHDAAEDFDAKRGRVIPSAQRPSDT